MTSAAIMDSVEEASDFGQRWNDLEQTDRIYIRRLVRTGRPFKAGEEHLAALGAEWARFQRSRLPQRFWWAWFVPAMLVCIPAALRIHPLVAGVILAAAAQWLVVRRNIKKAAQA